MGFDAGLYRYPKYKERLSSRDLYYIEEVLSYQNNDWAQGRFSTAEEYALYTLDLTEEGRKSYNPPSAEAIQFYIERAKPDEFDRMSISENMGYWCSNGSGEIYEWFRDLAASKNIKETGYGLTVDLGMKDVADFALFCWQYIVKHMPEPCVINRAFKYIQPEDDDISQEEYDIRLMRCDGIEAVFEDDVTKRFDTNEDYGCEFFMPKEYYNDWEMNGYFNGLQMALEILRSTNFDMEYIQYNGGW